MRDRYKRYHYHVGTSVNFQLTRRGTILVHTMYSPRLPSTAPPYTDFRLAVSSHQVELDSSGLRHDNGDHEERTHTRMCIINAHRSYHAADPLHAGGGISSRTSSWTSTLCATSSVHGHHFCVADGRSNKIGTSDNFRLRVISLSCRWR